MVQQQFATVDYYGTHTGMSVGSTTSYTNGQFQGWLRLNDCPIFESAPSGGANVCAAPTNFQQTSVKDAGNGDIHFVYSWVSSSGNMSDLSNCSVLETVTYSGSGNYAWPTPFPAITSTNPTVLSVPASDGLAQDDNGLFNPDGSVNTNFRKPYFANSFAAQQTFKFSCSCFGMIRSGTLLGPLSIQRQVSQNSDTTWKFTATKPTNGSATISPLP